MVRGSVTYLFPGRKYYLIIFPSKEFELQRVFRVSDNKIISSKCSLALKFAIVNSWTMSTTLLFGVTD